MWGGRFGESPDAVMDEINASIDFDRHLYRQDIAASKAHAAMLAKQGIISAHDAASIAQGLDTILSEIETGAFSFNRALEDIHMNVEGRLSELIGPAAGRLHTARSRNDQVATDFRLWIRDTIDALDEALAALPARPGREGARQRHDGDAGLHASADRAAGDLRAPSPGLCRDGGARPRPLRGCAPAPQRMSARRRRARRHLVPDRPRHDRQGARLRPPERQFARRRLGSRFRAGDALRRRHHVGASVAFRRGDRDLDVAAGRGWCCCPIASRPDRRSCRRSAIPMPPSWCAPRPAA